MLSSLLLMSPKSTCSNSGSPSKRSRNLPSINKEFVVPSSHDSLVTFLKELGYKGPLEVISDLYVDYMHQPWRTLATIINKCLSGKTSDFQYQIDYRQSKFKRREIMPYPRFTKVIIQYFLSQQDFIFKRHGSYINIIKDDGILGRLKFISKGELTQVYGLLIPDTMVNDEIKNSLIQNEVCTEAEIADEEQRIHETHASIVIGREQASRIDKEAVERQKKKKMKGIATDEAAQELLNLKKFPNEPENKIQRPSKERGSDEEEIILSIDDEETELEKETAKSEKADDKTADEEEGNSDDEVHTEEDEQTDDEAHDDEYVNNDVEKHDDVDEEMNNVENDDEVKEDQEMVDAKKVKSKKIEEEKNEKTELPPYTSSLSLSSDYDNQFFNLSFDVSLVGTVKETTDTEISSLLDKNPAFLAQSYFTPVHPVFRAAKSLSEYGLKKILLEKMDKSRLYMTHEKHYDLYNETVAMIKTLLLDQTKGRRREGKEKILSRPKKSSDWFTSKGKTQSKPSSTDKPVNAEEPLHEAEIDVEEPILNDVINEADQPQDDVAPHKTWFNDLVNAEKDPLTFDELMATPIDFSKFSMNRIKLDKITKEDLVGPVYKLLKGTCKSCIELEHNMDQCYNALTDQLD
ncbi:hypothetical protein Tco_1360274 [Tanacetum coccineum]